MQYRPLGMTGLEVSSLAFGAGPVPALMTEAGLDRQVEVVKHAVDAGINWFDTAATYGDGRSEANLGAAIHRLGITDRIHVATKVRLLPEHLGCIAAAVRESVAGSLSRLGLKRVTLLQLHNSITASRGDEPTSLTPDDILQPGGVLDAFRGLQREGLATHLGLTALGQPAALRTVIESQGFSTLQVPFNILNQSAGRAVSGPSAESDYGNIIGEASRRKVGVFAMRVFAGGALLGNPPSSHTHRTPFFPLALYERDRRRAAELRELLGPEVSLAGTAIRFVIGHPGVTSAIVGFADPKHIDEAADPLRSGPLPAATLQKLQTFGEAAMRS